MSVQGQNGIDVLGFSEAAPGTGTPKIAVGGGERKYEVTQGDYVTLISRINKLLAALYAAESTPGELQIDQPSLKPYISVLKAMDLNDPDPTPGLTLLRGMDVFPGEKLNVASRNATDEDTIIGLWLGTGKVTQNGIDAVRPTHRIRGTDDLTATANSWTVVTLDYDNELPEGHYSIVGICYGAYVASGYMTGLARVIFPEQTFQPGVPILQAEADKTSVMSAIGLGFPWEMPLLDGHVFTNKSMPKFEVLSPVALTDHVCTLELVKVK